MDLYSQSQVTNIEAEPVDEERIRISYMPIMESLYYSPGANVIETDNGLDLELVRCEIDGNCSVTHQAEQRADGSVAILVENVGRNVSLVFDDGRTTVFSSE